MPEKKEPIDQRYIDNLEKHKENTLSNIKYSIDRFDILIISISSGALAFSMNFVKDILDSRIPENSNLIITAWIAFGAAIVFNLFSQVSSFYANKLEIKITKNLIQQEKGGAIIGNQKSFEKKHLISNVTTQILNGSSLFLVVIGVILLVIFMSTNLN